MEHPGQSEETRGRPRGLEYPGEEGERPWTGSAGTEQEGGANNVPAPVSTGDKQLGQSKWSGATVGAGTQPAGLEHTVTEGKKPRTRASGTEQGGKKAASRTARSRGTRTDATDGYVRGRARRQEGGAKDWNMRGSKENSPGLDHHRMDKKEESAIQIPPGTRARAEATGEWTQERTPQGWGVSGPKARSPRLGHPEHSRRHQDGTLDWSIRGKQANRPRSSGAEHKGGVNKVPTPEPGPGAKGWSNWS